MNYAREIDVLIKNIGNESNRLIKEVNHRAEQQSTISNMDVNPKEVPWIDFEALATKQLGFNTMGWKSAFENQIGLKEGVLKQWNLRGVIPYAFLVMCDMIKPTERKKGAKAPWSEDEKSALREFVNNGLRGKEINKAMLDRFGDRRDYMRDGPVFGQMRRMGLTT